MVIQPNSATVADTISNLNPSKRHNAASSATTTSSATETETSANTAATDAAEAWSSLSVSDTGDSSVDDAAAANRLMQMLTQSMSGSSNSALNSHSGLDPQTVLELLQ